MADSPAGRLADGWCPVSTHGRLTAGGTCESCDASWSATLRGRALRVRVSAIDRHVDRYTDVAVVELARYPDDELARVRESARGVLLSDGAFLHLDSR